MLLTVASQGTGVPELVDRLEEHLGWLDRNGVLESRRRERYQQRVIETLRDRQWSRFFEAIPKPAWGQLIAEFFDERLSPQQVADRLLDPHMERDAETMRTQRTRRARPRRRGARDAMNRVRAGR